MEIGKEALEIIKPMLDVSAKMRIVLAVTIGLIGYLAFELQFHNTAIWVWVVCAIVSVKALDDFDKARTERRKDKEFRERFLDENIKLIGVLQALPEDVRYLVALMVHSNISMFPIDGIDESPYFENALNAGTEAGIFIESATHFFHGWTIPNACFNVMREQRWILPNFPDATDPSFQRDVNRLIMAVNR